MDNNKKIIKNIEKCVQDASIYINVHGKHYLTIFGLLEQNKEQSKEMFNDFIKLFIMMQMFLRKRKLEKKKSILKSLVSYKKIFDNILELQSISDHQKVDAITIKVYIKILIKLFKKADFSNTPSSDSDKNNICVSNSDDEDKNKDTSVVPVNAGQIINPVDILKRNKKYLAMAVVGLKNIVQLLTMVDTIFSEMKMEYLQKINCYNLYDPSLSVNENDVEFNEKLLSTSYDQLNSLISNKQNIGTSIFNDTSDVQPIEAFLDDGKTFVLCTIDNFRIKKGTINGFNALVVDIGKKRYHIKYLKNTLDNLSTIVIMKENFTSLKTILHAILMNKKLIMYWLNILRENTK